MHVALRPGWDCTWGRRSSWQEARSPHQHTQKMQVLRSVGVYVWRVASKFILLLLLPQLFKDLGAQDPKGD